RPVSRCSVSVEAHYREFLQGDKYKIQKTYRSIIFQTKPIEKPRFRLVFKQKRAPKGSFLFIM
ncbi:hypothetical protein, partial [Enterobacter sp.]|uniref:hypothetical protein n=1 Tax=Enterobacter sp. TaxID=42895 RepID=UPI00296EC518